MANVVLSEEEIAGVEKEVHSAEKEKQWKVAALCALRELKEGKVGVFMQLVDHFGDLIDPHIHRRLRDKHGTKVCSQSSVYTHSLPLSLSFSPSLVTPSLTSLSLSLSLSLSSLTQHRSMSLCGWSHSLFLLSFLFPPPFPLSLYSLLSPITSLPSPQTLSVSLSDPLSLTLTLSVSSPLPSSQHVVMSYPLLPAWKFLLRRHGLNKLQSFRFTALTAALEYNRHDLARACVAMQEDSDSASQAQALGAEWRRTESLAKVFIHALGQECGKEEVEAVMETLSKTLIRLIEGRKPFFRDLFSLVCLLFTPLSLFALSRVSLSSLSPLHPVSPSHLLCPLCWQVYVFERESSSQSLWSAMKRKLAKLVNIETLHASPLDWEYVKRYLAQSPVLIDTGVHEKETESEEKEEDEQKEEGTDHNREENSDKKEKSKEEKKEEVTRFEEVLEIVKGELAKQQNTLETEMEALIRGNEDEWARVVSFEMKPKNPEFRVSTGWRQDAPKHGLKARVSERELNEISLNTDSVSYDARKEADVQGYLTDLLNRAHVVNPSFQSRMAEIFKSHVRKGPVKGHTRCKAKTESDYSHTPFPNSASVIDVAVQSILLFSSFFLYSLTHTPLSQRCSATFATIPELWTGIQSLLSAMESQPSLEDMREQGVVHLELMRLKNGFHSSLIQAGKHYTRTLTHTLDPTQAQADDEKQEEKEEDGDKEEKAKKKVVSLPIPSQYRDIKFNLSLLSSLLSFSPLSSSLPLCLLCPFAE